MPNTLHLRRDDLIGFSRLAIDATDGITDVVEDVHQQVSFSGGPTPFPGQHAAITALVYQNIRTVTALVNHAFTATPVAPVANENKLSSRREAVVAALNGVIGDYLVRTNNPLAISMSLRRGGHPLVLERDALRKAILKPSGRVLLLVHGVCLDDLQWRRRGHDHGAALARDLRFTSVYLQYNSGLHISENGRLLAGLLEKLVAEWPVKVQELVILGHSMGGLVCRSAYYYADAEGSRWRQHVRKLVFLGTPHHGAPLEQLGNWADTALDISRYSKPFARIGKIRSSGITDMRYGNLRDEDWKGRDRFQPGDVREHLPLPSNVESYALAASKQRECGNTNAFELRGDGLVPVSSALGIHADPKMSLQLASPCKWIGYDMDHWDLLSHPAVYRQLKALLSK